VSSNLAAMPPYRGPAKKPNFHLLQGSVI